MPGGGEQCIDGVAGVAEEEVPVQPAVGFHVANGGLDGRSSFQLAAQEFFIFFDKRLKRGLEQLPDILSRNWFSVILC